MTKPKVPKQNPEFYRQRLRFIFLALLRHSSPCRAAVDDLTAEWNGLAKDRPDLSSVVRFHDLPTPTQSDDPLNAYIAHVRSIVANTLRCRVGGEPADWVCQELHEAACGMGLYPEDLLQPETLLSMDVSLTVSIGGSGWVWTRKNTSPVGDPFIISDPVGDPFIISGKPGTAFTSWEQLSKAAHERVDAAINTMQAEVNAVTSSWPHPRANGDETRKRILIPKIIKWLVRGQEVNYEHRSRAYTLLHDLGLDTPGRSQQMGVFWDDY